MTTTGLAIQDIIADIAPDEPLPVAQLRELNQANLDQLKAAFHEGVPVVQLVHQRATFIDELLTGLWRVLGLENWGKLVVIAVGGYGRGELHPYSDIDLLVLSEKAIDNHRASLISTFITSLWDIRLEVGHSVRTVKECLVQGKADITIATNLMESRCICGSEPLFLKLQHKIRSPKFWPSEAFFKAKLNEQNDRHNQYDDTAYNLEPNLKANPGGLRDIQTIGWVAKNHFGVADFHELVTHGFLTVEELQELLQCQAFLWQLRFALHCVSGRAENRLLFDYQGTVAKMLGYHEQGNLAVEKMMKRLYQTISRVIELNQLLLQLFDEAILGAYRKAASHIIDNWFERRDNQLHIRQPEVFTQPERILEMLLHVADDREITQLSATTLRELRQQRRQWSHPLQDNAQCRALFVKLLRHPRGTGRPLALMHRHGVLSAYLPAWQHIFGQMQFDLFHAYTVDEHTYRVTKNIYRFNRPPYREEFPLARDIIEKLAHRDLLVLAALFHDIAKGRGGDHSELGAKEAYTFCELHGYASQHCQLVAWLVENHLLMSVTAQKRDIYDPDVVKQFAEKVQTQQRLDFLYCLTVADIRATNDNLWNDWKGTLLRELHHSASTLLAADMENIPDLAEQRLQTQVEARALLSDLDVNAIEQLWARFEDDYFVRHTPLQLAWHARGIITNQHSEPPLILASETVHKGGTEFFIYTEDKVGLFRTTVDTFDSKNLNIHDAQIHSTKDGYTLDTFVVLEQDGSTITSEPRIEDIVEQLVQNIRHEPERHPRPRRLPRQHRHFSVPTVVTFIQPEHPERTMLELSTLDRPGLLLDIATVFTQQGLSLTAAKITTVGERAEDFFSLITREQGKPLTAGAREHLRTVLIDSLDHALKNH